MKSILTPEEFYKTINPEEEFKFHFQNAGATEIVLGKDLPDNYKQLLYAQYTKDKNDGNKYYAPTIDEFCVGFEYEMLDPDFQGQSDGNQWKFKYCDKKDLKSIIENWKYYQDYRIKYLDREDIESIGWLLNKENTIYCVYSLSDKNTSSSFGYILEFSQNPNTFNIKIAEYYNGEFQQVFLGSIKNKSELKKLMKQLNIVE